MTLNNGIQTYRSDFWLGVDSPGKFDATIWPTLRSPSS
jgi:hypothetical protein